MHKIAPARIAAGALVIWTVAGGGSLRAAESGPCAELAGRWLPRARWILRQISQVLFKAADRDCAALADQLLQHGASPHARDGLGRTALIKAARAGSTATARVLLERGAPVDQPALNGSTALFVAVENDKVDIAEMLLAANADVNSLGAERTVAARGGRLQRRRPVALRLLERGADPEAPIGPTRVRSSMPRRKAVPSSSGACSTSASTRTRLRARSYRADVDRGPPGRGSGGGRGGGASLLLDRGVAVDDADDRGRTALMIAAEQGHQQLVRQVARGRGRVRPAGSRGQDGDRPCRGHDAREPVDGTLTERLLAAQIGAIAARSASGKVSTIPVMPGLLPRSLVLNWCRVSWR